MTTFLFGASSMLGWSMYLHRPGDPDDVVGFCNGFTREVPPGIDRGIHLDDPLAVFQLFAEESPSLIVHCAGVCDVEKCEESPEFAYSVNVDGMQFLVDHAPPAARIVYLSSDHVFSGDGTGPYREDTPPDPVSVYGQTRVAAEQILLARGNTLVIRSGPWIGPSSTGRNGHLDWLRYRHRKGLPMTVVADESRSVVWAEDAARRAWALAASELTGIRHITATRAVARPELATFLDRHFAIGAQVAVETRADRRAPHPGHVELATIFTGELATPLPSVVADDQSSASLESCGGFEPSPNVTTMSSPGSSRRSRIETSRRRLGPNE